MKTYAGKFVPEHLYHEDLEKRGGCGRTVSKREATKNLPAFKDLSGRGIFLIHIKIDKKITSFQF